MKDRERRWMVWALLGLTAVVCVVWSRAKLLSQDEMFVLQTDSVRSLRELVRVQRWWPVSLDPLLFHVLGWVGCRWLGAGELAVRLPSLVGFLVFQGCLFRFMRVAEGWTAGLIAMAAPAVLAVEFYAVEARPYGLLLGLLGCVMVCWQQSWRDATRGARVGLAVSLMALLNTHYFAVLLLVPVFLAEFAVGWQRRRMEWKRWLALGLGCAGGVGLLPFVRGAGAFREHYYNTGRVSWHAVTMAYRALVFDNRRLSPKAALLDEVALVLGAALLVWMLAEMAWRREIRMPVPERVLVGALSGLPLLGWAMARWVTHAIEVRYVVGAVAGIACAIGIVLAPVFEDGKPARQWVLPAVLLAAVGWSGFVRVRAERVERTETMMRLRVPDGVRAAVLASPKGRLYLQNLGEFEVAQRYEPDLDMRARMTLVWSRPLELAWDGHDTISLTAEHLEHFTSLPIVPYEQVRAEPGEHVFALYHGGWDWTDPVFSYPDVDVVPLGPAMGGDAVGVRFLGGK